MRYRFLLWRLLAAYSVVVIASLLVVGWYAVRAVHAYESSDTAAILDSHADLAAAALRPYVRIQDFAEADALCKRMGRETGTRITLIRRGGEIAGDSFESIDRMENHADRPEIQSAIRGKRAVNTRESRTLGERLTYLAVPVPIDGQIVAVVRASLPLAPIERITALLYWRLACGLLMGTALATAAGWFTAGWLYRSIASLHEGADRISAGNHGHRIPVRGPREIAQLAGSMNRLVGKLDAHISEANRHRTEGEAILSSMVEGVFAVDTRSRVISMNGAAGNMLGIGAGLAAGLPVDEAAPNREVQRFVTETLRHAEPLEAEFALRARTGGAVHAQGTPLRDGEGKRIGAVVVLHDVTRLRRLEQVRRDFVANVSHELKTPITAIKGYIDTVLDSQLHDPKLATRSMQTVAKHAGRLNAIIEDLLALSRIEQDGGAGDQRFEIRPLAPVLEAAIQRNTVRATDRRIQLALQCDPKLTVRMNASMLEKAVVNLVENAILFSDDGEHVEIKAERDDNAVFIHVIDYGCGIEAEHIPRVFDRFYRVDTANTHTGGTGLGLAIVQHIARAHEGAVRLQSVPGEGSTFTLALPG